MTPKATGGKGGRFDRAETEPRAADHPEARLSVRELLRRVREHASHAEELQSRLQRAETALGRERDARQRAERALAAERVGRRAAESAARAAEDDRERLERARSNMTLLEHQVQITWTQLAISERELLWARRPLWRKLLRRPPKGAATDA